MRERLMETREHDEHIGNNNQRNQILSKNNVLLKISFYRDEGKEVITKRRDVTDERFSRGFIFSFNESVMSIGWPCGLGALITVHTCRRVVPEVSLSSARAHGSYGSFRSGCSWRSTVVGVQLFL